jgi:hypothetical protein
MTVERAAVKLHGVADTPEVGARGNGELAPLRDSFVKIGPATGEDDAERREAHGGECSKSALVHRLPQLHPLGGSVSTVGSSIMYT